MFRTFIRLIRFSIKVNEKKGINNKKNTIKVSKKKYSKKVLKKY